MHTIASHELVQPDSSIPLYLTERELTFFKYSYMSDTLLIPSGLIFTTILLGCYYPDHNFIDEKLEIQKDKAIQSHTTSGRTNI